MTDKPLKYYNKKAIFVFSDLNLHRPFWTVVCPELIGEDTNESGTDGLCAAASASAAV